MSGTEATPATASNAEAPATTPSAPSADTAAPQSTENAAPTFVQSAAQVPATETPAAENQHAPKPETVSGDWRELIPVDLRGESVWDKYHSPEQAFKGLVELNKLVGKKEIPVGLVKPEEGASAEEVSKYKLDLAKMLGVPDSDSRYNVPESAQNLNGVDKLKQMAHKSGLGSEQFSSLLEQIAAADADHMKNVNKTKENNMLELQKEWGESYTQNLQVADIGLDAVDKDGAVRKILADSGLNMHPAIIKHYHELGAQFREGSLKTGSEPKDSRTIKEQVLEMKRHDNYANPQKDGGVQRAKVDAFMKANGLR